MESQTVKTLMPNEIKDMTTADHSKQMIPWDSPTQTTRRLHRWNHAAVLFFSCCILSIRRTDIHTNKTGHTYTSPKNSLGDCNDGSFVAMGTGVRRTRLGCLVQWRTVRKAVSSRTNRSEACDPVGPGGETIFLAIGGNLFTQDKIRLPATSVFVVSPTGQHSITRPHPKKDGAVPSRQRPFNRRRIAN
ncbi:RING finger protein 150-like protein [Anopheles sinensis]|uniref:RING finger protein 150-like protein n=1 Tax=Anopheles sinensis TaxID=74873 RepID=A0A084WBT9_ANOSI|nr:RING finger protein 150-like protein [Anopheles sinensis]